MPKNCKNCGTEMPEEAHICLFCLTETEEKAVIAVKNKSSFFENKKRTAALIAAAVLIVVLIIVCIFCFVNKNNTPANSPSNIETDKTVVSTITEEDGSVITEYDDGSVETVEPDGTTITKEKDGTVITKQTDGTVVTETPDKTVITEKPDGTVKTEKNDGTVETKKPDGTTITEKPDGTVETKKPDGTTETKKPDGTTEIKKPDGTTEIEKPTEKPTDKPTEPSTSEPSTENTTGTTENNNQPINYDDFTFEYKDYTWNGNKSKKLAITKYTGNDEVVNVPATYNGEDVDEISITTFFNNSKVKKVIFNATKNHVPNVDRQCIMNCKNLEEVVFNWSNGRNYVNDTYSIKGLFSTVYDNFKSVKISGCDYYKVYENGLYYNESPSTATNSYELVQAWGSEWHQPSWCKDAVDVVFDANTAVKEVYLHTTSYSSLSRFNGKYLTYIHIDDDNKRFFDDNGVVYDKIDKECVCYPQCKPEKSYTFLDGYSLNLMGSFFVNQTIQTIYIPKDFVFYGSSAERFFNYTNRIQTVYVENGNPYIDYLKENFKRAEVIIY